MKQILLISVLFMFIGCASKTEKLNSGMKPFMTNNFPDANYDVIVTNDLYQLVMNDEGNVMNQDNYEPIAAKTFSELYKVFLMSSKSANKDSKFEILYENESMTWKSDRLTLTELSEIYKSNSKVD